MPFNAFLIIMAAFMRTSSLSHGILTPSAKLIMPNSLLNIYRQTMLRATALDTAGR